MGEFRVVGGVSSGWWAYVLIHKIIKVFVNLFFVIYKIYHDANLLKKGTNPLINSSDIAFRQIL